MKNFKKYSVGDIVMGVDIAKGTDESIVYSMHVSKETFTYRFKYSITEVLHSDSLTHTLEVTDKWGETFIIMVNISEHSIGGLINGNLHDGCSWIEFGVKNNSIIQRTSKSGEPIIL